MEWRVELPDTNRDTERATQVVVGSFSILGRFVNTEKHVGRSKQPS